MKDNTRRSEALGAQTTREGACNNTSVLLVKQDEGERRYAKDSRRRESGWTTVLHSRNASRQTSAVDMWSKKATPSAGRQDVRGALGPEFNTTGVSTSADASLSR